MNTVSSHQNQGPANEHQQDILQIRQLVASVEKAHNQKTPQEFAQLFAEDAVFVNAAGVRLQGREQIYQATDKVMKGFMAKSYAKYELVDIKFIGNDVAIASIEQHPVTKDGQLLEGEIKGMPTYVLTREGEKWIIVAGQNTIVQKSVLQNAITK